MTIHSISHTLGWLLQYTRYLTLWIGYDNTLDISHFGLVMTIHSISRTLNRLANALDISHLELVIVIHWTSHTLNWLLQYTRYIAL